MLFIPILTYHMWLKSFLMQDKKIYTVNVMGADILVTRGSKASERVKGGQSEVLIYIYIKYTRCVKVQRTKFMLQVSGIHQARSDANPFKFMNWCQPVSLNKNIVIGLPLRCCWNVFVQFVDQILDVCLHLSFYHQI